MQGNVDCGTHNTRITGGSRLYDNGSRAVLAEGTNFGPINTNSARSYAYFQEFSPQRLKRYEVRAQLSLANNQPSSWFAPECAGNFTPNADCLVGVTFPTEADNVQDGRSQALAAAQREAQTIAAEAQRIGGSAEAEIMRQLADAEATTNAFIEQNTEPTEASAGADLGCGLPPVGPFPSPGIDVPVISPGPDEVDFSSPEEDDSIQGAHDTIEETTGEPTNSSPAPEDVLCNEEPTSSIQAAAPEDSGSIDGSPSTQAVVLNPMCRAVVAFSPPLDIRFQTFPPTLAGAVDYPPCFGTLSAKLTTRRSALVCIQVLDRSNPRRPVAETVRGSCRAKRTRTAVSGFRLPTSISCPGRKSRFYRIRFSLTIRRFAAVDSRTGRTDWQVAQC